MSSRMFQGVVLQMKDSIDRMVGVIDADGIVVACSELTCIGEHWSGAVAAVNSSDNATAHFEGKTFKPLAGWGAQFDYAAFVKGEDDLAGALCAMAVVAFNGAKTYYEEKHDKATFVKNIISDNILLGDIYTQAKELHFVSEAPRAAFLVRQLGPADVTTIDVIQNLFPDKQTDFVISINETDVALIKQLPEGADAKELQKIAKQIATAVTQELGIKVVIGIGTVVNHVNTWLRDTGMVVLRSTILVITPPRVSMPKDNGVTSKRTTSLTSPTSTPPWIAAPMATHSSGLMPLNGSLPVNFLTAS